MCETLVCLHQATYSTHNLLTTHSHPRTPCDLLRQGLPHSPNSSTLLSMLTRSEIDLTQGTGYYLTIFTDCMLMVNKLLVRLSITCDHGSKYYKRLWSMCSISCCSLIVSTCEFGQLPAQKSGNLSPLRCVCISTAIDMQFSLHWHDSGIARHDSGIAQHDSGIARHDSGIAHYSVVPTALCFSVSGKEH